MKNYFEIFSLPVSANLDLEDLEQKYLNFQKEFHPDKSSSSDIEKSIAVNEAFDVLKNNLSRVSHILQLNGIDLEDDTKSPKVDYATLTEVLEIRETIPEKNFEQIEILKKELNKKIKSLISQTILKIDEKNFLEAAQILIKAKYFDKTLQDLKKRK